MNPKLVIVSGPQQGQSYPLEGESFSIGRQAGNDLLLFEALPGEQGDVLLISGESETPELVARRGDGALEISRTVLTRVAGQRVALLWDDVYHDEALDDAESLRRIEVRSLLAAPLTGRRDLHGVLCFQSTAGGMARISHDLAACRSRLTGRYERARGR